MPADLELIGSRMRVHGQMVFDTVPCLHKLAQKYAKLEQLPDIIDLTDVQQADSSALALLLEWQAWANGREHQFKFVNVPASLFALAQVMGVDQLLNLQQAEERRHE